MSQMHRVMTAALLLGAAMPAFCAGLVVVEPTPSGIPGATSVTNLDAALDLVDHSEMDTIWLLPGLYEYNFDFAASDPAVTIIGRGGGPDPAAPLAVVIQAAEAGEPVVKMDAVGRAIVFQNLTLTGGDRGVRLTNGGENVVFDRCYIMGNIGHGVQCSGLLPRGTFVNCSIYNNGGDGVYVAASGNPLPATAASGVEILHCTILDNAGSGVYVAGHSAVRVRNSLVYRNAGASSGVPAYEYLVGYLQNKADGLNPPPTAMPGSQWSQWAFGAPTGSGGGPGRGNPDPSGAHTTTTEGKIYGVNLNGDYRANVDGDAQWALPDHDDTHDIEPTLTFLPGVVNTIPADWAYSNGTINLSLTQSVTIGDLNVVLNMAHLRPSQLKAQLTLVSPVVGNKTALLFDEGELDDHGFPNLTNVVFDDEATTSILDPAAGSLFGLTGVFVPKGPLSVFDGVPLNGTWKLSVYDSGAGAKYEYRTDFAAHGFVVDEIAGIPESQWNFLTPKGWGGLPGPGNPDPNGEVFGTGAAVNVNANGNYTPNVDGVYDDATDPNDLEYLVSGTPVNTVAGNWQSWTVTMPPSTGDAVVIGDLNVKLDIAHLCATGLKVKLIHEGTTVVLIEPSGDCASNFTNTLLDDEAANPIASVASSLAPFSDVYSPQDPLSAFDGLPFGGTWQLEVLDPGLPGPRYQYMTSEPPEANGLYAEMWPGSASQWEFGQSQGLGGSPGYPDPPLGEWAFGVNLGGKYTPNIDGDAQYPNSVSSDITATIAPGTLISDGATISSTLTVNGPAVVGDVNVVMTVTHPVAQNLTAKLRHGDVWVPLFANLASSGQQDNFVSTVFDDEASKAATEWHAPFSLDLRPAGGLSAFDGMPVQGPWILELTDALGGKIYLDEQFNNASPAEPADAWDGFGTMWVMDGTGMFKNAVLQPEVALCGKPGSASWQDYTFETQFDVADWAGAVPGAKEIGVVFCVQPSLNQYYKFVLKDFVGGQHWVTASLVRHTNLGIDVPLITPAMISLGWDPLTTAFPVHLKVTVVEGLMTFSGSIAGNSIPAVLTTLTDPLPLNSGTVGFVAQNLYGEFDYATVTATGTYTGVLNSWGLQVEPMYYLKTPVLNFSQDSEVKLAFKRWLNTGADSISTVDYSVDNGLTWTTAWKNTDETPGTGLIGDSGWQDIEYDLTAAAARKSEVLVRWGYHAGNLAYSGWNIDDVRFMVPMTGTINSWALYCEPMRYVKTPPLDFLTNTSVKLKFNRCLNTGADSRATIEYSIDNGGTWAVAWDNAGLAVTDASWMPQVVDLSTYASGESAVKVRWGYHAGQTAYSGWNVDDVVFEVEPAITGTVGAWKLQVEPMYYLTTDAMDFRGIGNGQSVDLRFWRWLNAGSDSRATIEYSTDNGTIWTVAWKNTDESADGLIEDSEWVEKAVSLPDAAGKAAYKVRWGYHAGQTAYSGWNVDDVTVVTSAVGGGGLVAEENTGLTFGTHNCSYANVPNDRVNFDDAAGAKDVDPQLVSGQEWGKLSATSELIDMADSTATLVPYTNLDFEGEPRSSSAPDIGADEVLAGGVIGWTDCVVTGKSLPGLIGTLAPGELHVQITLSPAQIPDQVFIAPQGVWYEWYLSNPEWFINLVPEGSGSYWTNENPITTVLWEPADAADGLPSGGDVIADGDGAVWVRVQGQWAQASGSAATGRLVLIDTVPPVLDLRGSWPDLPIMPALAAGAPAWAFMSVLNDPAVGDPPHPGYPSVAGTAQGDHAAPWDEGMVAWGGSVAGPGARIFFNTGSVANGLSADEPPLTVTVSAPFVDPPVMDAAGNELLSSDLSPRRVSGFDAYVQDEPLPPQDVLFPVSGPPARWLQDTGGLENVLVDGLYTVTDGGTRVSAVWNFVHAGEVGFVPGIPWLFGDTGEMYRLSAQFIAEDRAGNLTTSIADPATLCWIVRTAVDVTPKNPGDVTVHDAGFSWQLARTANPQALNSPRTLFSYALWSRDLDDDTAAFKPVTGWETPEGQGLLWTTRQETAKNFLWDVELRYPGKIVGKSVLFRVIGMDEAGNVTPWPAGELEYASGNVKKLTSATYGMDWVQFNVKADEKPTERIVTSLTPVFWYENITDLSRVDAAYVPGYDGAAFGAATKLVLPKPDSGMRLLGKMVIRATVPDSMAAQVERVWIEWELDAKDWRWSYAFYWTYDPLRGMVAVYPPEERFVSQCPPDPDDPDNKRLPFYGVPDERQALQSPQAPRVYCFSNFLEEQQWGANLGAFEPDDNPNDNKYVCTVYIVFPKDLTLKEIWTESPPKTLPCTFRARTFVQHVVPPDRTVVEEDPTSPRFVFTVTPSYSQTVYPRDTADKQPVISTETQEE